MVAIMSGADNGFFYAYRVMHFSGSFCVFLIYYKHSIGEDTIIMIAEDGELTESNIRSLSTGDMVIINETENVLVVYQNHF